MKRRVAILALLLISSVLTVRLLITGIKATKVCSKIITASPKIIWVPDNYTKIQWAVGNASDGDTIFVKAGTYYEQVTIDKSLTLIGENPNATIIDGFLGGGYVIKCNTSNVNISGFTIRRGTHGTDLDHSGNVTISGNIITDNSGYGVFLLYSSNNTIHNNTVLNNGDRGIYLRNHCSNNTVSNNTISNHREWGIYLFNHSSNNVVSSNTISYSGDRGIYLIDADNNFFNDNRVLNNTIGISIRTSAGNTLKNNKMNDNKYNFGISASTLGQYIQDIDTSNTINGKPIYYWVNQADKQLPPGAGYVAVINSKNITVKGQTLTNNSQGVLFAYTTNSTIVNVNALYNDVGIQIIEDLHLPPLPPKSSKNVIKDNILANNYGFRAAGIEFRYSSDNIFTGNTVTKNYYGVTSTFCNNTLYHNNFIDNINLTIKISDSVNIWDNGYLSGGNYWGDYNGTDLDGDGIGDVPYVINDKNRDNYPLMAPVISVDQLNISDDRCDVGSLQTVAFHAVWPHNSSDVVEGSVYVNGTKYVTNGSGWVSFNAVYETVGKRVWAVTGSVSFYIIWDRINITLSVSENRINVGGNATIAWSAEYEYDGSAFSAFLTLNNTQTLYNTVGKRGYTTLSVSDPVYGLTNFTSNSIHCIWDMIKIIDGGVSKTQTNLKQEETVWFKAVYEYDNISFDGTKGKLYVNGSEMTWSHENNRWEYNCSFNTAGTRIFQVTGVTDNQYALAAINDTVGVLSITWTGAVQFWMHWWFWMAIGVGTIVVIAIFLLKVRKTAKKQN